MTIKTRAPAKTTGKPEKKVAAEAFKKQVAKASPARSAATQKNTKRESVMKEEIEQVTEVVPSQEDAVQAQAGDQPITGRGVFAVRTLGDAVSVEAAFLAEDGNVLRLPAVFPTREYALGQIDELRQIVSQHFDQLGK